MKRLLYPALLGLALAGCAQAEKDDRAAAQETESSTVQPGSGAATSYPSPAATSGLPAQTAGLTQHPANRSVIYHGEMSLRVDDFEQATDRLEALLNRHGAVLGTAHETRANGQHQQNLTIKVKPEQFRALVSAIGKLGRIERKDVESSDVTADLLAARDSASAKQTAATRARQQAAATPGRSAELTTRAGQLQEAAEDARAIAKSLGVQTQWATLTLHLYQLVPDEETTEPLPAYGPQFAAAFVRGGSALLSTLVVLTNIWPLALLGGVSYWAMRRWRRVASPARSEQPGA
ncbi:DUF4349 domain-containing protein [Hymenobacter sp. CRA2]|uniref:DUF4349 domain-containing protein n=1 Tax=Hymenobacter sp. CRA2 TaxID=1955620 RepID=UPI00098EC9D4|nr:DUF4349 domain-containing protein [Hymenobacter sp. CRA2]OON70250.1 hypothetical protein B0919_05810 [Hymenobacter sp. CRA2]